jgi:hypothetical protein
VLDPSVVRERTPWFDNGPLFHSILRLSPYVGPVTPRPRCSGDRGRVSNSRR